MYEAKYDPLFISYAVLPGRSFSTQLSLHISFTHVLLIPCLHSESSFCDNTYNPSIRGLDEFLKFVAGPLKITFYCQAKFDSCHFIPMTYDRSSTLRWSSSNVQERQWNMTLIFDGADVLKIFFLFFFSKCSGCNFLRRHFFL